MHRSMSSAWHLKCEGTLEIVGIDTYTNVHFTDVIVSPSNGILVLFHGYLFLSRAFLVTCYF
jgi:hypothetical protein